MISMSGKNIYIMLVAIGLFLTSCSAPKKTAYHKPGNKSNTYKKPTPKSTPKNYERSEVTTRNADGYLKADGITDNKKLSSVVNEWLGVPHRMGGKDKSGIDCSGFTSVVLRSVYHKEIVGSSADMANKAKEINKSQLHEGDLVFFKIGGTRVSHVGVYLSNGYFAHATLKKGVLISSLSEPYYEKYYSGSGRIM